MHKRFEHKDFEKKWQKQWAEEHLYDSKERDQHKEKEYVLVELPYPSGNLHIGHWYAFAVPDIYVRYKRMSGYDVIYPMGFDAFGLPAENAAIKHNLSPREWTEGNIDYMKNQLLSMGNAFTWNMTASTIDPDYYKWTQWMFTKFYDKNLAYRGKGIVNWCPQCNTVIANEQVTADDTCERCGTEIEKREMPQWMLRITDFADPLIDDLEGLDWPQFIKDSQRNWIGRSEGAELTFTLSTGDSVNVFTTRPDTLYGATYIVLAPEHELLQRHKEMINNWPEVESYIKSTAKKAEQDRLDGSREKTGVQLKGITATNPATNQEIPVFIADYVLASYGTGAIMAVPAHDERDFEFAEKFNIDVKRVIESPSPLPYSGEGTLLESEEFTGLHSEEAKVAITNKVGGSLSKTYRLRDWSIGRQRYWGVPIPIVYDPEGNAHSIPEEHLPWTLPDDVDFRPTGEPPLSKSNELKERTERIFGEGWTPEVETMDTFVDSSWYFLRYLDNKNQEEFCSPKRQSDWMPIDIYFGGAEHTTMHLLYSRFFIKALHSLGLTPFTEPYTRRINRSQILGPDGHKMSKSKGNVIDPDEQVERVGADTVKMYLAFMGPYSEVNQYPWDMGGIAGIRRFLERVNGLQEHVVNDETEGTTRLLHKTIRKVCNDITEFKFNTAISALMVFVNHAERAGLSRDSYLTYLKLLAPFAPHLAEELWSVDHNQSIHIEPYPTYDESLAKDELVTIGVQINGKLRGDITITPDASEEDAVAHAKAVDKIEEKLAGQTIKKVVYVPGRILNFILENK